MTPISDWIFCGNVDKTQRKMNSLVKKMNAGIKNDDLWLGRFFIRQINRSVYRDEDYREVFFTFRFVDKQTLKYVDFYGSTSDWAWPGNGWGFFMTMNDFIVEQIKAWERDNLKVGNTIDYTKDYTNGCDEAFKKATPLYEESFNLKRTVR